MAFANDFRFALRQLRSNPGLTGVVLITLGLCIGANTAIFSVLDAVLFRPLPLPAPDRLALVVTATSPEANAEMNDSQTGSLFETVRDAAPGLDVAADAGQGGVNFVFNGRASFVQQQRVSAGYFRVLGISPLQGQEFTRADDVPNGPPLVIVAYDFWRKSLRGDPAIVGKAISLRGEPYTVIGVMPGGFRGPSRFTFSSAAPPPVDVWTPLRPTRNGEGSGSNYQVIARLKPGVSWPEATGQLQALSRALMEMPGFPHQSKYFEERIIPLQAGLTQDSRRTLVVTWAAVLVVLLIGCVNIAGLLMARAPARAKEIATRLAVGGSRGAIVRQLLIESLVLSAAGSALGLIIGSFAIDWLKRLGAESFEVGQPIELDARVMGAMALIAVVTSILFGLAPAIRISRLDVRSVLAESGRGIAGRRDRMRSLLAAGEIALSLVLLVSAGLLVRTLAYFQGLSAGFDPHNLVIGETSLLDARYKTLDAVSHLYSAGLSQIRASPGVKSAAVALTLPYERPLNDGYRQLDGYKGEPPRGRMAEVVYVTPGYFETMAIPLLGGRVFRESDARDNARVIVVSESFARTVFGGGQEAMGRHLGIDDRTPREIVGVVSDVQQHSGLNGGLGPFSVEPTIYLPVDQTSSGFVYGIHRWFSPKWVVRTNAAPSRIAPKIQAAIAAVAPELPISHFKTMDELSGLYLEQQRYTTALFSMMAALGLALAAIGLYGLISNAIAQRTHELGIRMALGASVGQIIAATARPGILLALAGIAVGAVLARAAARLIASMLWGVHAGDAATFAVTAGILLVVSVAASLIPCARLLRLDPARTLHSE